MEVEEEEEGCQGLVFSFAYFPFQFPLFLFHS